MVRDLVVVDNVHLDISQLHARGWALRVDERRERNYCRDSKGYCCEEAEDILHSNEGRMHLGRRFNCGCGEEREKHRGGLWGAC